MNAIEDEKPATTQVEGRSSLNTSSTFVKFGVAVFGVYHLVLALFMAIDPHGFFKQLGPFGVYNRHYIRDLATYDAAIGVALLIAIKHQSWRVPALTLVVLQFMLHSVNHLIDVNDAHPKGTGYLDLVTLILTTLVLCWLLRAAINVTRWEQETVAPKLTSADS